MNGLFGAVLAGLGFRVTRLCGGVNREILGDVAIGNHLTLRVDLERPYLAEVGVADAIIAPVPLAEGKISQRGFDFAIMPVDGGWMRFRNHARGIARSFDFHPGHSDEDAMADLFVHDIEEGIQGTEIKAAFLKCAADEPGVTPNVEKVHRAIARASVSTSACHEPPICSWSSAIRPGSSRWVGARSPSGSASCDRRHDFTRTGVHRGRRGRQR